MAQASQRPDGSWRARWRDVGGQDRSRDGFATENAARCYSADRQAEVRAKRRGEVREFSRMTWGEWADLWLPVWPVSADTKYNGTVQLEKHVRPRWGNVPLADITAFDIQGWVTELAEAGELAPSTLHKVARLLSTSLRMAAADRRLPASPYVGIKLPKVPPRDQFYFTVAQVERVLAELDEPYRTFVKLLVYTGMRYGELAALHWQRVDFDRLTIDVAEVWLPEQGHVQPYTKNGGRRTVPIMPQVADLLAQAEPGRSCGQSHRPRGTDCRSPLVVPGPSGVPVDDARLTKRHWQPALERAGLVQVGLHQLRHTYASWMAQNGLTSEEVGKLLGHIDPRSTKIYIDIGAGYLDKARQALALPGADAPEATNVIPLRAVSGDEPPRRPRPKGRRGSV